MTKQLRCGRILPFPGFESGNRAPSRNLTRGRMGGYGGTGRHAVLRGQWRKPCEFESHYPHQLQAMSSPFRRFVFRDRACRPSRPPPSPIRGICAPLDSEEKLLILSLQFNAMKQFSGWMMLLAGIGLYGASQFIPAAVSVLFALGGMVLGGIGGYLIIAAREKK